ncbi:MAG: anion-transporting ArsA/GET3 family ATPase [Polyangiales bacterium]|jgi:anion-transporting  ArsA/GET3 family ATPase
MVTGKGGVGKTTVALSLAASYPGARLVQFDMPSGPEFVNVERLVLRSDRAVENVATQLLGSRRLARTLLGRESVQALLGLSDAIRVVALLERVRELYASGVPLVIDMPATGHALAWFRSVRVFRELTRRGSAHDLIARIEDEILNPRVLDIWAVSIPTPVALSETAELCEALKSEMGIDPRLVINRDLGEGEQYRQLNEYSGGVAVHRLPVFPRVPYEAVGRMLGAA